MSRGSARPEISAPQDFEHFLHVGASNLGEVNVVCKDQQKLFEQVRKTPLAQQLLVGVGGARLGRSFGSGVVAWAHTWYPPLS